MYIMYMHIYDHDIVNYQTRHCNQYFLTALIHKTETKVGALLVHVVHYYYMYCCTSVQYGKSCSGHPYNCVYITLYVCHRVAE